MEILLQRNFFYQNSFSLKNAPPYSVAAFQLQDFSGFGL
jgi:hypothetical protein